MLAATKRSCGRSLWCALIAIVAGIAAPARATTVTWTGAVDNLWTTPGNWAGGAPSAGDRLVFPGSASNPANTNDYAIGTTFFDITFLGSGYTLGGSPISLSNGISDTTSGPNLIAADVQLAGAQTFSGGSFSGLTLSGQIDLGANTLTLGGLKVSGPIIGSGAVTISGYTQLTANNTYTGATQINSTGASIEGTQTASSVQINSGYLYGNGVVGDVTVNGYGIFPGGYFGSFTPKVMTTGNLTYAPGFSYLLVNLNGTTAGVGYEQIAVNGSVALGSSVNLNPSLGFTPTVGQTFVLIDNDGVDAVSGTFSGLAEGATIELTGNTFAVSYMGGSGNDVVLTCTAVANNWTGAVNNLWSVAGNWSDGVPGPGDILYFPAGAANPANSNDLALTTFNKIVFTGSGYTLSGNPIALSNGISDSTSGPNLIAADIQLAGAQTFSGASFSGLTLSGQIDLGANTLTLGGLKVSGPIIGSGAVTISGYTQLTANNTYTGATQINSTGASIEGTQTASSVQINSGYLYGNGVVGDVTVNGYGIFPGGYFGSFTPKVMTTGNLTYAAGFSYLVVNLNSTTAGIGYEQIAVNGSVALGSSVNLYPSLGFTPTVGQTFVLIDNDGVDAVSGTFSGLAEGATIELTGNTFAVSYMGGSGNDVVLTCTAAANNWTGAVNNLWSVAGNWSDGVPGPSDSLYFPAGAANLANTNDLALTTFNKIVFTGSGYTLSGNPISLSNGISDTTSGPNLIAADIQLVGAQTFSGASFSGLTLAGQIDLGANTLTLGGLKVSGPMIGSGGVTISGYTQLTANNTYTGATQINSTGASIEGTQTASSVQINSGYLYGNGVVGDVTVNGYGIFPGGYFGSYTPKVMTTGNLTYAAGFSYVVVGLNGATAGLGYEQIAVNGSLTLGGSVNLYPSLGFTPAFGQIFILISNDGADAVIGTFSGLPEGTVFNIGPYPFQISYIGKTGNDVILTSLSGDPLNSAPIAVDDSYTTTQDTPLTVVAPGVLANDSDPDLSPISVILHQPTSAHGGTVMVNPDGSFTYTPPAGYTGTDTFTYIISDGHDATDTATVTIDVTPPPTTTPTQSATSTPTATPTATDTPSGVSCSSSPLSVASPFNVFVLGNATLSGSDVDGRMAIGGDGTLRGYSVGLALPNSNGTRDDLIVGDDLSFHSGQVVNGNLVYGATATLVSVTLPHGSARQDMPIDFSTASTQLQGLSTSIAALAANGTTTVTYHGARAQVQISGSDPLLNVFAVTASDLSAANSIAINVPAGATAIVNVSGLTAQIRNLGIAISATTADKVLFNFPQATALTIEHIGVQGSVLAPFAAIAFNGANLVGQLVAGSLSGSGQVNLGEFSGCRPPTALNALIVGPSSVLNRISTERNRRRAEAASRRR